MSVGISSSGDSLSSEKLKSKVSSSMPETIEITSLESSKSWLAGIVASFCSSKFSGKIAGNCLQVSELVNAMDLGGDSSGTGDGLEEGSTDDAVTTFGLLPDIK